VFEGEEVIDIGVALVVNCARKYSSSLQRVPNLIGRRTPGNALERKWKLIWKRKTDYTRP
jgi:hypothetical protein